MLDWKVNHRDKWSEKPDSYSAHVSATVDVSACGETRGINRVYVSVHFGIYPRSAATCHGECFPYLLLLNGQGRIYLRTVEEGKRIAEEVCDKLLKALRANYEGK